MAKKTKEISFEEMIETDMLSAGYIKGDPKDFDKNYALFPDDVIAFVKTTQPKFWQKLVALKADKAEESLIYDLNREINSRNKGLLDVMRNGFKCVGSTVNIAFFKPSSSFNADLLQKYEQNILRITRQLIYSPEHNNEIDMVLSVNGLPVVTMELKNELTRQTFTDAIEQYKHNRNPDDMIFRFKRRALVNFAVSTEQVCMTTKLAKEKTFFLPFNKGHNFGAGNPHNPNGYKTEYLWKEVLTKDSLMDILAKFLHLEQKEDLNTHKIKETMIFPRYHQLDAVRKLVAHSYKNGSGHNYLIQHSAGSGKSNSIAWLAYRLSSLHDAHNNKIFNSVIVLTDRRVLDQQLQNTIAQFEHKTGVVKKIKKNTEQLIEALVADTPIIISTIQKFPFIQEVLDRMNEQNAAKVVMDMNDKRFAIVIDEAHSSQSGEAANAVRQTLSETSALLEQFDDDCEDNLSDEIKKQLLKQANARQRKENLSYYAFTATPKFKTMAIFDEAGENGKAPFHEYTMKQAIEEGFIMDVLKNYTTYQTFYNIIKKIDDNPQVPKSKAMAALKRFVKLHDYDINQNIEIIVEHFKNHTRHKIGGCAKAMIVTSSRLEAVRYKRALDKYLRVKKTQSGYDFKALIAFSGTVSDDGIEYTEVAMNNGISESALPKEFEKDDNKILLVADKYQTGFDQPLLHTMYVVKKLANIQAVQTLSRLNRICAGKEDTFVLDFVNSQEDIHDAFINYYKVTEIAPLPTYEKLYELANSLNEWNIFDDDDTNALCEILLSSNANLSQFEHKKINMIIDRNIAKIQELSDEEKEEFYSQIKGFISSYPFISQIMPFADTDMEKKFIFYREVFKKMPKASEQIFQLSGEVDLQYYRKQKMSEGNIILENSDASPLKSPSDVGTAKRKDDKDDLDSVIYRLNERFGTEFTEEDELIFSAVEVTGAKKQEIIEAAKNKNNKIDDFKGFMEKLIDKLMVERMHETGKINQRYFNDPEFKKLASDIMIGQIS